MIRAGYPGMPPQRCKPQKECVEHPTLTYSMEEIERLLSLIPLKADKKEVIQMQVDDMNYVGHFATADQLPTELLQPSWALVGSLEAAEPYFFYTEYVPIDYVKGWNNLSAALGTYNLLADKVSIFDYMLLTEYNVSNNYTHETKILSRQWRPIAYAECYPTYNAESPYLFCERVNMPDDVSASYQCVEDPVTTEAPYAIEESNRYTLTDAIELVPEEYRIAGMKVTFVSSESGEVETWIFISGNTEQWCNEDEWKRVNFDAEANQIVAKELYKKLFELPELTAQRAIADEEGNRFIDEYVTRPMVKNYINEIFEKFFKEKLVDNPPTILDGYITPQMLSEAVVQLIGGAQIENLPDEEDLTTKGGYLSLKDRVYNPNQSSGKGYTILRRSVVNGVNVLLQRAINNICTIYEVRYDFNLNGEGLVLPKGCVVRFNGGSLKNGSIDLNGCLVETGGQYWEECFDGVEVTGLATGQLITSADGITAVNKEGKKIVLV